MACASRFSNVARAFSALHRRGRHIRAALSIIGAAALGLWQDRMSTLRRLGVVMDPIGAISYAKDSTLAMLLAAQARGFALAYLEQRDLLLPARWAFGPSRALPAGPAPPGGSPWGSRLSNP